ncbi:MAG: hypothetical protein IPP71_21260 [Bacteroidetes bacterium]|nr:hypothetical protein [Bacteroidota bacterium]
MKFKISPFISFVTSHILFLCLLFILPAISQNYDLAAILAHKQAAFYNLIAETGARSAIKIPILEPSIISIIKNAPQGFLTCFTRPFLTDTGSFLITISALENIFVIILGLYAIYTSKIIVIKRNILPYFCLFYTITFFTLIGLVTPVMGAIVRYKAQALPFLLIFFIILMQAPLKSVIQKLKIKNIS